MSRLPTMVIDAFCMRQFTQGAAMRIPMPAEEFERKVNEAFESSGAELVEGYAPFCKHFFTRNFVGSDLKATIVELTDTSKPLVVSEYKARTQKELPVLTRWIPLESLKEPLPTAEYLDIILYSREQIIKEEAAMGKEPGDEKAPWGIVSIKPQMTNSEIPMQPITMLRNALGKDEGGSGVPLEREKYNESVAFWDKHVSVI